MSTVPEILSVELVIFTLTTFETSTVPDTTAFTVLPTVTLPAMLSVEFVTETEMVL